MNDSENEIKRIQNLPIEERKEALFAFINKIQQEAPETIACFPCLPEMPENEADFPFGPIPHWIKCSDQPPEEKQECLVAIPFKDDYTYDLATYIEGGFISWTMPHHKNLNANFWMPLPKRPGEND